ncbi:hypothetical protein B7P43_G03320 [Cryptotermes secundus]|uniref:Odorant receptor n=1 Tax=Cryptotermes secundus TaxID=105785 RepID=A0A2J7PP24_9NEOP|nr:hypothetical protein B7P43_G03320 [Cryptotermes secundus]
MLPSLSTYSSPWKYQLYNLFSAVTFLSYIPLIIMQFIGIYKYSGNLTLLTVIIFQLAAYFDGMVNMAYFIYHRKRLLDLFYLTENKFNPFMKEVGTPEKQIDIIGRNKKFERNITTVAMGAFLADMCTWCVLPSIVRYLDYFREENLEAEEHLEYFILVMWLPENAATFPFYEMLHIFQFLSVWGVVANYAAEDECHTFSEETTRNIADTNISSCSSTLDDKERSNSILYLSEMGTQNPALRGYTSTIDATKMMARSSSTVQEFSSEVTYLIKCIRYHQNLLKFCVEVNDFLSNVLLFDLIIFQILMCLPPLQLILGQNVSMLRFVSSIVDTGIWPLLICFWGEALSNQSLSVQRAAYGCSWYNRSQSLKKLLHFFIMRSKKPVRMTAGKFYYISLETFADVIILYNIICLRSRKPRLTAVGILVRCADHTTSSIH